MVVTRKTGDGLVPPAASRTNSSQILSRHRHNEAGPTPKTSKPAPPQSNSGSKSSSKIIRKKSQKPHKSSRRRGLFDRFLSWIAPLVFLYVVWYCPSDHTMERPVCRSLSVYADYVLRPFILPPLRRALSHPTVQPYVEHAIRFEQRLEPRVRSAVATTTPYAVKTKEIVWDGAVLPVYRRYLVPSYNAHVYPHLHQLYTKIDPYISPIHRHTSFILSQTSFAIHRTYTLLHPHVHRAYVTAEPYAIQSYQFSLPYLRRGREFAQTWLQKAYLAAKPYLRLAYFRANQKLRRFSKQIALYRKLYVDKHVRRIWDKVQELSGSRDLDMHEPKPFNQSQTLTTTTATSSPSAQVSTQVSASDEPTVVETLVSVSSIVAESAHTTIQDVSTALSSIVSSISESSTPSVQAVGSSTMSSSFFASAASVSPDAEDEAGLGSDADDGLENLLRDLGLSDIEDQPAASAEDDDADDATQPQIPSSDEPPPPKEPKKTTAEKRADITSRHDKWAEQLEELSRTSRKAVRKMLVRIRKGAVSALWDKSDAEPELDTDSPTSQEDLEKLRFIEGERISHLLDNLASEGDKLLKGLEAYLRREEKAITAGGIGDLQARHHKWYMFLEKVEEKFSESVQTLRGKVHRWFVQVRDIEIRDCLAASAEMKALADKAQANLGLDYVWLDDVTYHDWQRYHELMRVYDRFDEQIRMIQNGTHPSPPIDPLPPALDKLQVELNDISNGWATRVRAINSKALHEVFVAPATAEPGAAEPEVSILPIDPQVPPLEQEEFDASQVIIGKSEAQIKQAMEHVGPEEHIEL